MSNYHYIIEYHSPNGDEDESYEVSSEFDAYREASELEQTKSGGYIEINSYFFDDFEETLKTIQVSWKNRYKSETRNFSISKKEDRDKEVLFSKSGNTSGKVSLYITNTTNYSFEVYIYYNKEMHDIKRRVLGQAKDAVIGINVPSDTFSVAFRIYKSVYLYPVEYSTDRYAYKIEIEIPKSYYHCTVSSGAPLSVDDLKGAANAQEALLQPIKDTLSTRKTRHVSRNKSQKTAKNENKLSPTTNKKSDKTCKEEENKSNPENPHSIVKYWPFLFVGVFAFIIILWISNAV